MYDIIIYVTLAFVAAIYFAALYLKDASIMDIFWGAGFILNSGIALYLALQNNLELTLPKIVVASLILIWGLRLSWHIFRRHKGEDPRYTEWRTSWGKNYWWRSIIQIFILQGALMIIILIPVFELYWTTTTSFNMGLLIAGVGVWILGFVFETVSDMQLAHHISQKSNKGKILDTGLWRYSRHPNYFGEALLWWGIFLIALSTAITPWYILAIGPAVITILVRFVSGVPMLEERMSKNPIFSWYAQKTNIFVPWFPKK